MAFQRSTLNKQLSEILDPGTSPEKALQSLVSSFTPEANKLDKDEHVVIFLAYIRYIMTRQPDGCVEGIWEEILKKSFRFSRNIESLECDINKVRETYPPNIFIWVILTIRTEMCTWLDDVLSSESKCPNPYIRLELFRLIVKGDYYDNIDMVWEYLFETFIFTICEINPNRYYPSYNEEVLLFDIGDLNYIISTMHQNGNMDMISSNIMRFFTHIIKLIGVLTVMAGYENYNNLSFSYDTLQRIWQDFEDILSRPQIRPYLIETVCELTAAIVNKKGHDAARNLFLYYRDLVAIELDVCSKPSDLPRLLSHRQLDGSRQVRQHSLLFRNMYPLYNNGKHYY